MKDATTDGILERLIIGAGTKNEPGLAIALGISAQSIYNAKKKEKIPPAWGIEIAKTFGVSLDWIFFGRGPMRPREAQPTGTPQLEQTQPIEPASITPCVRCERLEEELAEERRERRGLSAELREVNAELRRLARENSELIKENAELRKEKPEENLTISELRKRKIEGTLSPLDEQKNIPPSDRHQPHP